MSKKQCTKCLIYKESSGFHRRSKSRDGLDSWCRECKREHYISNCYVPNYTGSKVCTSCKLNKSKKEFHVSRRRRGGLESRCKLCNIARRDNHYRKKKYNISLQEYENMLVNQNGVCAICEAVDTGVDRTNRFSIDHDHVSGTVRGLLCNWCNQGLGMFKDSSRLLNKAIKYLETNNNEKVYEEATKE